MSLGYRGCVTAEMEYWVSENSGVRHSTREYARVNHNLFLAVQR